jgi:DNA (cytosine-5)-methyltransferase 1
MKTFACKDSSAFVHCGFTSRDEEVEYHHEPRTTYQVKAREAGTTDLQQYTRCFDKSKVDR